MDSRQSVGTQGEDAVAPPLDVKPPSISGDSPPVIPSSASARAMACDLVVASVARACMDAVKVHHARWIEKMGGRNVGDFSGGFALARCARVNKLWRKQFDGLWDGPTCPSRDWAVRHVLEHVRDRLEMHTMMDESDDEDEWKTVLKDDPRRDADPGLVLGVERRATGSSGSPSARDAGSTTTRATSTRSTRRTRSMRPSTSTTCRPTSATRRAARRSRPAT